MSALVSITTKTDVERLHLHQIHTLPVVVLYLHNQCNCRCVMCDIWRRREATQLSVSDVERLLPSFRGFGVRWVVFSGGEPQLNEQWSWIAHLLRKLGCRITLLTAGLLLKPQAKTVAHSVDDVIISLDGPPPIHNAIRRVADAYERIAEGVAALRQIRPAMEVRARCTVQKANHRSLRATVEGAKCIGLTSVSFLAADVSSTAFNRPDTWSPERQDRVALTPAEIDALELEIEQLIADEAATAQQFVVEKPDKLRRIVKHFRAQIGLLPPSAPRCNAPWVSAVIEASGDVRPCFFQPAIGNIYRDDLSEILNAPLALEFRSNLDISANEICRRCVCSLHLSTSETSDH